MLIRRLVSYPIRKGSLSFHFCGLSGTLFSSSGENAHPRASRDASSRIQDAIGRCSNPYLLSPWWNEIATDHSLSLSSKAEKLGIKIVDKLIGVSRHQFLLARLYSSWRVPLFATAREAVLFFRLHAKGDQEELCLARALFAAKTSRRFAEEGAVVIGVFLPSRAMHAWVIEGDDLADPYDGIWINYQPVAILS